MKKIILISSILFLSSVAHGQTASVGNTRTNAFIKPPKASELTAKQNGNNDTVLKGFVSLPGCENKMCENIFLEYGKVSKGRLTVSNKTAFTYKMESAVIIPLTSNKSEYIIEQDDCAGKDLTIGGECSILFSIKPEEYGVHNFTIVSKHNGNEKEYSENFAYEVKRKDVDNNDIKIVNPDTESGIIKLESPREKSIVLENLSNEEISFRAVTPVGINGLNFMWSDCPGISTDIKIEKIKKGERCVISMALSEEAKQGNADILIEHTGISKRFSVPVVYSHGEEYKKQLEALEKQKEIEKNKNADGTTVENNGGKITVRGPQEQNTNNIPNNSSLPNGMDINALNQALLKANGGQSTEKKEEIKEIKAPPPSSEGVTLEALSENQATFITKEGIFVLKTGEKLWIDENEWDVEIQAKAKRVILKFKDIKKTMSLNNQINKEGTTTTPSS